MVEAGATAHPGGHERPRPGLEPRLPQVREDLRRHLRQLSIRMASSDLPAMVRMAQDFNLRYMLSTGRETSGRLRRSSGGHAVHRSAPGEDLQKIFSPTWKKKPSISFQTSIRRAKNP